jgi:hypothetical protein
LEEKTRCEKEYKRDVENDNRLIQKLKRELDEMKKDIIHVETSIS